MKRDFLYKIADEAAGSSVEAYLRCRGYTSSIIRKLKQLPGSVFVDNVEVYLRHILHSGETIRISYRENESSANIIPISLPLDIVYEDKDLVIVNKPGNMPIHPSLNNYKNTLANGLAYYYRKQKQAFVYRCINRLDRDTTGLTIVAKHAISASILYEAMRCRQIHRSYIAIVENNDGSLASRGSIDIGIGRKDNSLIERCALKEGGAEALTHYEVVRHMGSLALVRIWLETGRTHQIRVHMKYIGHPLIGDYIYNPYNKMMDRPALHSESLEFTHPITGEMMEFRVNMPGDMAGQLGSTEI